ncbi:MAG: ElyC/SanA/YdcF family protein [Calothrix sp. MO_167.B12]|nr:ElyC/SanA/YdcF family protein [Calothrix sp. MO_167.B12]
MPRKIYKSRPRAKIRLIKRQEIWMLTFQGWVIAIALIVSLIMFAITQVHPFLAVNSPITADVLVVEGWVTDYTIKAALSEFTEGDYRHLVTTGIPVERGSYLAEYQNFAEIAAASLKKMGLESEKIAIVPSPEVRKDRTYASAIAFRQWLESRDIQPRGINIVSESTHARRSWLIYKKVLTPKIKVGIISIPSKNYEPQKWWIYSAGVRAVINETVAYLYALIVNWRA